MLVIGLTGSIGMGKTTAAAMFREHGVPVQDADAVVHALYSGAAVAPIEAAFPGTTTPAGVDREALGRRVLGDAAALEKLEAIVHPLVSAARDAFVAQARARGERRAVLDIPLLFETGSETSVDVIVVVSAPPDVQKARVLARSGMTTEKFAQVLARQMPDAEKRSRAHFIIDTGGDFAAARRQVADLLTATAALTGSAAQASGAVSTTPMKGNSR
jgi:dephospho-CoA kinase